MKRLLKSKLAATFLTTNLVFGLLSVSTAPVDAQETESSLSNSATTGETGRYQMMIREQQSIQFIVIDAMCPYYLMIGGLLEDMLLPPDVLDEKPAVPF